MQIQTLLNDIKTTVKDVYDGDFEIETVIDTEYDETNWIDIRLIGAVEYETEAVQNALHNGSQWVNKYADHIGAEVPTPDEIRFGFGGTRFERVYVELPDTLELTGENEYIVVEGDG